MYSSGKRAGADRSQAIAVRITKLAPTTTASAGIHFRVTKLIIGRAGPGLEKRRGRGFPRPRQDRLEPDYGQVVPTTIGDDGPAFAAVWFGDVAWTQYDVAVWLLAAPSVYVERSIAWS